MTSRWVLSTTLSTRGLGPIQLNLELANYHHSWDSRLQASAPIERVMAPRILCLLSTDPGSFLYPNVILAVNWFSFGPSPKSSAGSGYVPGTVTLARWRARCSNAFGFQSIRVYPIIERRTEPSWEELTVEPEYICLDPIRMSCLCACSDYQGKGHIFSAPFAQLQVQMTVDRLS
ncbi:uncharacterized protein BT62DRAFT_1001944 [Guyanagaster necrorhizus]|uniref:Uncharacterized protein n=1 Tax=Guyanagaster necrorhizus TaxID=856835 RepID=A0A9P7W088_9AGAR|nr:uncharacterized protein BT62DRAFT_1001944 [Guyanagaster necrorhizus MCA 3950]KAG7449655.1 hypothetical protein BT62DRAFT_1001944 [Guyanagaster necrorhizus MCA 3950]